MSDSPGQGRKRGRKQNAIKNENENPVLEKAVAKEQLLTGLEEMTNQLIFN